LLGRFSGGAGIVLLDGELDEFRLWKVARTEAEIAQNLNERLAGNETDLVLYCRMDDGAGLTTADASLNANDLLLVGRPRWIGSTAPVGQPVATTLAASDVAFGNATLNGTANGESTLPTRVWFEHGDSVVTVPDSAQNIVYFPA
jgi:hypothetical protein